MLRLKKGLTQEKFAELCNLNTDNYRNIEHNRHTPSAETINKICDTFNINPIELLQTGRDDKATEKIMLKLQGLSPVQLQIIDNLINVIRGYEI